MNYRPAVQCIVHFCCDWQLTWNYLNGLNSEYWGSTTNFTTQKTWSQSQDLYAVPHIPQAYPPPNQPLTTVSFTFLGENLSAVLPGSDHFAWDLPKELHDQSDVVCPPPHTSQREQARFSITACTHTSTRLAVWDWHTAALRYWMDTLRWTATKTTTLQVVRILRLFSLFSVRVSINTSNYTAN